MVATVLLIGLTLVFTGTIASFIFKLLPYSQGVSATVQVASWVEYSPPTFRMEATFEHLGGQPVKLSELAVVMSGTDRTGVLRNYRSDRASQGVVPPVTFEVYDSQGVRIPGKTDFCMGESLKAIFTLQSSSYLFDTQREAVVSLIHIPSNQLIIRGENLVSL